jgi:hypothetical protein
MQGKKQIIVSRWRRYIIENMEKIKETEKNTRESILHS